MARQDPPRTPDGVIITDEMADDWAREAEAGYDIDPASVHRVGRKSLDGGAGKSPQITLRLPSDTYDRVVAAAAKAGESVSALVRDAVQ
jgi:hypothetical protein